MEKSKVQKFIAFSGLCSRKAAEKLIEEGRVKVNKKQVKLSDKCLPEDLIEVDDKKITFNFEKLIYIILNKPYGYLSAKSENFNRKTIYDLIAGVDKENIFSVGRLDTGTTGLLILTNDGHFSQSIIYPSKKIIKEYDVYLDKALTVKNKEEIEKGLILDYYQLSKCEIQILANDKYTIRISEERKKQIRGVFELKGYRVVKLHRRKIGNLDLQKQDLKSGEYKEVTKEFLEKNIF